MSPPPYHLRTNKAVERLLFIELLRKLDGKLPRPISDYQYVGLGGPYLEDFAVIHKVFSCKPKMVSLEVDPWVRWRQCLNRPHSNINLTLTSTAHFVDRYQTSSHPLLVWFDYSQPRWKEQLAETCDLLRKVTPMSIYKVTLACSTQRLGGETKDPLSSKAEKLNELFGDYGPFEPGEVVKKCFPATIFKILRLCLAAAIPETTEKAIRTLAAYTYDDGTPILTVTLIVGPQKEIQALIENARLKQWPYSVLNWEEPKEIAIPNLSLRERLAVDRLLPDGDASTIQNRLKLRLEEDEQESTAALARYIEFHQHVPHFLKMAP